MSPLGASLQLAPRRRALGFSCLAACCALVLATSGCGGSDGSDRGQRIPGPPVVEILEGLEGSPSLRGIAVRDAATVWVSGTSGAVWRSTDSGITWQSVAPPGSEELDFRDIQLLDDNAALVMSVGPGEKSRIYKTVDAGATWERVLQNDNPDAFYNSIAFWDSRIGLLTSDSKDGQPMLLRTEDGGMTWNRLGKGSLPPLLDDEAGFAASGTVVATAPAKMAWAATGGAAARVFRSKDGGDKWRVFDTPLPSGEPSKGIFSIAFRDKLRGVIVGGDYRNPDENLGNAAWTADGGKSWQNAEVPEVGGMPHRSCVQHLGAGRYLATGRTGGLAFSEDDGQSWAMLDGPKVYTIGYDSESGVGYMAGGYGSVSRFTTSVDPDPAAP